MQHVRAVHFAIRSNPSDSGFDASREELGLLVTQEQQRFGEDERKG